MIQIGVHSQNLRGSVKHSLEWISSTIADGECTAILLQDLGIVGPDGPPSLRAILGEHKLLVNSSKSNKSRTVAIIIHKEWFVHQVLTDESGSLVGAVIARSAQKFLIVSAYLPTGLDNYGSPIAWDAKDTSAVTRIQEEAHGVYRTLSEWTSQYSCWIIGGDLNETRSVIDRERLREVKLKSQKFVNCFLEETGGVDMWRTLYPEVPGFTYRNAKQTSFSRLDYFLVSSSTRIQASWNEMEIGNWEPQKDHCRISLRLGMPDLSGGKEESGKAWSIPQPELRNITSEQIELCKERVNERLKLMEKDYSATLLNLKCAAPSPIRWLRK